MKEELIQSSDFTEEEFKAKLSALDELPIVECKDDIISFPRARRAWPALFDLRDDDYQISEGLMINGKLYRGTWWKKKGDFQLEVRL